MRPRRWQPGLVDVDKVPSLPMVLPRRARRGRWTRSRTRPHESALCCTGMTSPSPSQEAPHEDRNASNKIAMCCPHGRRPVATWCRTASLELPMRNGRRTRRRHQQQELPRCMISRVHDQPRLIQMLYALVLDAATQAQVVEVTGSVDAFDRAQPRAPTSDLDAHRDADLGRARVIDGQRLQAGMQAARDHQPSTRHVRCGQNPIGHRRITVAPPPPLHRLRSLPRSPAAPEPSPHRSA